MELGRKTSTPGLAELDATFDTRHREILEEIGRILPTGSTQRVGSPALSVVNSEGIGAKDFSDAIDLIHQAAERVRLSEAQAEEVQERTKLLLGRAKEELEVARALANEAERRATETERRLVGSETRARTAEARAAAAEERASVAEDWLKRLNSAIVEKLRPAFG
jgi:hypothetical protein